MKQSRLVAGAFFLSASLLTTACEVKATSSDDGSNPFDAPDNSSPWLERTPPPAEVEPPAPVSNSDPRDGTSGLPNEASPNQTGNSAFAPLGGQSDPIAPVVPVPGAPASFADLVQQVQPAVVNIYTEQVITRRQMMIDPLYGPYAVERNSRASSLGSGFIVDQQGYILTNTHVVESARSIKISLNDGREFPAVVIGSDPKTDIALIKVEPFEGMTILPMGTADSVRVGDWLMAVGNPFGLQSTVTVGILSARGRKNVPLQGEIRYMDFLQTDASINPGNSGGPLIDMQGRAVGINTAINAEGQGIGFAIPIDMARTVLEQLRTTGTVSRSWLGIQLVKDPSQRVEGALVGEVVAGGPSAMAGIQRGDVIVSFDGKAVRSSDELPWIASNAGIGQTINVGVVRNGSKVEIPVVMGALPH